MASIKYEAGAIQTLMTTQLDGLANAAAALGVEYDNSASLYLWGLFELNVTFGTNPTAGSLINLYLIPAADGTNYADNVPGAGGSAPSTMFAGGFPLRAVTTAQRVTLGVHGFYPLVPLPPAKFKVFVVNNSGQAFPASGSTLKMVPYRLQSV
jgi:hypothetical protein